MKKNKSMHGGFTLVELLIVVAIIGTLMALLLPAVNAARERARQMTCTNNLKELGLAMNSFATSGKGTFPGWMQWQKLSANVDPSFDMLPGNGNSIERPVSWAAKLLPQLDQQGLWEQLLTNNNGNGFDGGKGDPSDPYDAPPVRGVFNCPSDVRPSTQFGMLTYVVNAGAPDIIAGSNYVADSKANGICHNLLQTNVVVRKGADIKDGESTTLLLSENIHKDDPATGGPVNSWLSSSYLATNAAQTEQPFGMVWTYMTTFPNPQQFQPFNKDLRDSQSTPYIDEPMQGIPFRRPASSHPEIFLAVFVGGNTRSISETIDYRVYQQLMTPNGAKAEDTITGTKEVNGMNFMTTPLSDADY